MSSLENNKIPERFKGNFMTSLVPTPEEIKSLQIVAESAANSRFFQNLGGQPGMLTLMLYAKELGISPMQAIMGGINIIQGKAELSPRLMNALIRQKGHKLNIKICNNSVCEIEGERYDTKEKYSAIYTLEEARKSGLIKEGGAWTKYPSDMLFKSCLSRLARRLFPDIVLTSYVEGEVKENIQEIEIEERIEPKISSEQVNQILELLSDCPDDKILNSFLSWAKIENIIDIPSSKFDIFYNSIKKKKEIEMKKNQEMASV